VYSYINSEILYSSLYDAIVFYMFSSFIAVIIIIIIIVTSYTKRALKGSVTCSVPIYNYTCARNVLVSLDNMSLITRAVECQ
jgi:pilus assembly protein TadC